MKFTRSYQADIISSNFSSIFVCASRGWMFSFKRRELQSILHKCISLYTFKCKNTCKVQMNKSIKMNVTWERILQKNARLLVYTTFEDIQKETYPFILVRCVDSPIFSFDNAFLEHILYAKQIFAYYLGIYHYNYYSSLFIDLVIEMNVIMTNRRKMPLNA